MKVVDYINYHSNYGRNTLIFCPDGVDFDEFYISALKDHPSVNEIRAYDPKYLVHCTSIEAGKSILEQGALKSFCLLEREEQTMEKHQFLSSDLNEPDDFKDLICLA